MKLPSAMTLIGAIQPVWNTLSERAKTLPETKAAIDATVDEAVPALSKAIKTALYKANGISK